MNKIIYSLKRIDYKLYFSLLFLGLCPTVYTTLRIFFLGQMPNEWAYSIAGQLSWVNLLYELFNLVIILLGFYVLFAFQNVFDATFYGLGKTNYMLFESIITNSVYYGIAFLLYYFGVWTPTLTGIAFLFGFGIAFDSIVSFLAYIYLLKKYKIKIV